MLLRFLSDVISNLGEGLVDFLWKLDITPWLIPIRRWFKVWIQLGLLQVCHKVGQFIVRTHTEEHNDRMMT